MGLFGNKKGVGSGVADGTRLREADEAMRVRSEFRYQQCSVDSLPHRC